MGDAAEHQTSAGGTAGDSKPWAPVGLPLDTVSVEIFRKWHSAYLALGSNMGDKEKYLRAGVKGLQNTEGCVVERVSDFITTAPYGGIEQDDFLNGAMKIRTLPDAGGTAETSA